VTQALVPDACLLVGAVLLVPLTLIVFGAIAGASVAIVNPLTTLVLPTLAGLFLVLFGLRLLLSARPRSD